jgi:hypothetical protein
MAKLTVIVTQLWVANSFAVSVSAQQVLQSTVRAIGGRWFVVEALDMLAGGTLGCLESIPLTVRACKICTVQAGPTDMGQFWTWRRGQSEKARASKAYVCGCGAALEF